MSELLLGLISTLSLCHIPGGEIGKAELDTGGRTWPVSCVHIVRNTYSWLSVGYASGGGKFAQFIILRTGRML